MMTRTTIPALAGIILCMLCGCARQGEERTADGRLVIHYWEKWTGFEGEAMQAVVDDYNASQDRVFVRKLIVSEMDQKLMLATAGGNPPDVAGLWSHSLPDFAEKGALTPLDGALRKAGITSERYIGVYWDICSHRGLMWALPTTPASVALHWNKRMFREAGLNPNVPPTSLAELDRFAERLTIVEVERDGATSRIRFSELTREEREQKRFSIVQMGHLPQEPGWWSTMWGYWFGGRLWDGERAITAESDENKAAFAWVRSYAEKYGVDNMRSFGASFGNFSSPQNAFLSERVAMEIQGVWMYNFIEKYAPHLEWGAAPFPSVDPETLPDVTIAECDVLVIPRGSPHPIEAFDFIRYVNTQGPMEKLNLGQRKFSPLVSYSEAFVREHPNPAIETFIALARSPNARRVPRLSFWFEYRDELSTVNDRVLALTATPREALADVQKRVEWKGRRVWRRWDMIGKDRLKEWQSYDAW